MKVSLKFLNNYGLVHDKNYNNLILNNISTIPLVCNEGLVVHRL